MKRFGSGHITQRVKCPALLIPSEKDSIIHLSGTKKMLGGMERALVESPCPWAI